MKRDFVLKYIFFLWWLLLPSMGALACTSAIISGKLTKDGRPLMWKNRDTGNLRNSLQYYRGEIYNFVAVVNSSDVENPRSIWMGTNEKGFSIMNTLSYNLRQSDDKNSGRNNGAFMKRALEICATVEDFKCLLDTLPRPLYVCTNYGVIDAAGGAAYFETSNEGYELFDVNDPLTAPEGYLVRTNYSLTGEENVGAGYVRYQQATIKIAELASQGNITPQSLFNELSRSFENPLMGIDLTDGQHNRPHTTGWFCEQDFIARRKSSCAVVVQGIKPDENPELTTFWVLLGYPPVTPAIPIWVKDAAEALPDLLTYDETYKDAPLCFQANLLREEIYSYKQGDNADTYFNWELLFNQAGTGYMQRVRQFEAPLFEYYTTLTESFYENGKVDGQAVRDLYGKADNAITTFYENDLKDKK